ncbi:unnamed protein product [Schistosoma mattheei]|uniref:Uncharacterized protein n=1 Tax=Schistosoma mattheei TaxID=31246 RepID=A0A3P8FW27_9TREM|nr:unnamed protein product [Schistosoma mattheei]
MVIPFGWTVKILEHWVASVLDEAEYGVYRPRDNPNTFSGPWQISKLLVITLKCVSFPRTSGTICKNKTIQTFNKSSDFVCGHNFKNFSLGI